MSETAQKTKAGMILAAGLGLRMRPLTLRRPKPLLPVGGRPMLDIAVDAMRKAGVLTIVVNAHHLAEQIAAHVALPRNADLVLSHEKVVLETGGGVKKALEEGLLRPAGDPFFVMAGDMPLRDGATPALSRLAAAWDPERMDALLLVAPRAGANGFSGAGDFMMARDGALFRKGIEPQRRDVVFVSAMLVKAEPYRQIKEEIFSNNLVFDLAERRGRLFGLLHDGACFHVGTPEDLAAADAWWRHAEGGAG